MKIFVVQMIGHHSDINYQNDVPSWYVTPCPVVPTFWRNFLRSDSSKLHGVTCQNSVFLLFYSSHVSDFSVIYCFQDRRFFRWYCCWLVPTFQREAGLFPSVFL
jgi:hypothetical protein